MNPQDAPEAVVQRQLDAYNAKDLQALLACYADDAELLDFPDKPLECGREALHARYLQRLAEPDLHARLVHRAVVGNRVVDHEVVTRNFPEGRGTLEVVMVYEVVAGRIARSWSIAGTKVLL